MSLMNRIWERAKSNKKTIVLPEGSEERNLTAASIVLKNDLADLILIGNEEEIKNKAEELKLDIQGARIVDPNTSDYFEKYANLFYGLRKNKGVTLEQAFEIIKDPVYFGTLMVKNGDADGLVSGAIHTSGDTIKPGLQIIKTSPGVSVVSGFIILIVPDCEYGKEGVLVFADCAVNPNPDSEHLASIAICTAENAMNLCDMEPIIAMLSFSSKGSAKDPLVDKVTEATRIVKELRPDLRIDGELQLDAAIVESVAELKAKGSPVAGHANVLIFPDLDAGNIGYKLVERFAKADAIGPICQGFAKPINDLSRGCNAHDIVNVICVTAIQAQNNNQ
ncbi:MAG: phosphate acetyltransferase [Oscillospiraceae bacterium]|nr:phosphate acetyltransferase [Oscillospiraceae bacterium]